MSNGPLEIVRERYRAQSRLPFVENLLRDARYALRALRNSAAFTFVSLITLALGIGANVVVFGVLNAVLLQPLHVSDPQSLYQIRHKQWMIGRLVTTSYPAFEDFQRRNTTFSGMAALRVYDIARIPEGCRHPATRWARCLMARHRADAACGDRERNLRAEDVA